MRRLRVACSGVWYSPPLDSTGSAYVFDVVLYQPEIPPNTGNIMRLCANAGTCLHLIEPPGFGLEDRQLRRAGLDYREWAEVWVHSSLGVYLRSRPEGRLYACSTRGRVPYRSRPTERGMLSCSARRPAVCRKRSSKICRSRTGYSSHVPGQPKSQSV